MNNNNKSMYNPYPTDVGGVIDAAIKKYLQKFQTCIPAIIKEVKGRNKVVVSPAVQQVNSDWQSVSWADITLPVYTPAGNDTFVSFPLSVGDCGWIIAGDLDPSLFFQDVSNFARQNVFDRHKYQYGFFLPTILKSITVDSGDADGIVIKNGDTKIVVKGNEINIVSNNELKINTTSANITASGNIKLESTGSGGKIEIKTAQNNNVEIDGLNFKSHCHISAAEGSPTGGAQAGVI